MLKKLVSELKNQSNPHTATILAKFFKTGQGQYGEGDQFIGIKVPILRQIAKKYWQNINFNQLIELLQNPIHEYRMVALFIMILQFTKSEQKEQELIVETYLNNTQYINNWDLVDLSAPKIIGAYLLKQPAKRTLLYQLAKTDKLWKKRIAMLSCYTFIKQNEFSDALKIAEILLNDEHDLIHKAVGWMLREIGKIDLTTEENFLKKHAQHMPRTMLRYAIEKFEENKRQFYLKL